MKKLEAKIFLHCYDEIIFDPIKSIGNLIDLAHKNDTVKVIVCSNGSLRQLHSRWLQGALCENQCARWSTD